jgi:hypothetical protein
MHAKKENANIFIREIENWYLFKGQVNDNKEKNTHTHTKPM